MAKAKYYENGYGTAGECNFIDVMWRERGKMNGMAPMKESDLLKRYRGNMVRTRRKWGHIEMVAVMSHLDGRISRLEAMGK